jgi:hypothetical protein
MAGLMFARTDEGNRRAVGPAMLTGRDLQTVPAGRLRRQHGSGHAARGGCR